MFTGDYNFFVCAFNFSDIFSKQSGLHLDKTQTQSCLYFESEQILGKDSGIQKLIDIYLKGKRQYFIAGRLLPIEKFSGPPDSPIGLSGLAVSPAVLVRRVAVPFPSYVTTLSLLRRCPMGQPAPELHPAFGPGASVTVSAPPSLAKLVPWSKRIRVASLGFFPHHEHPWWPFLIWSGHRLPSLTVVCLLLIFLNDIPYIQQNT